MIKRRNNYWVSLFALGAAATLALAAACSSNDTPTATSAPAVKPSATSRPAATSTTPPKAAPTSAPAATATIPRTSAASATAMSVDNSAKTFKLTALNGSGQDGTVTLTEQGDKTLVSVKVTAGAAGVAQPVHIHGGQCGAALGGVDFPLTNVVDGKSETVLNAKRSDILSKDRAVNLHKSAQEASVYTSCGAISRAGATMAGDDVMMAPTVAPAATNEVKSSIKNFKFEDLTIKVGETVVWTNDDTAPHTVTAGKPGATRTDFRSGTVEPGVKFSYTFNTAGTFDYYCEFHTAMVAKVTVQ